MGDLYTWDLLQKQIQLQKEANELQKQQLAQEREKLNLEREKMEQQRQERQTYAPPMDESTQSYSDDEFYDENEFLKDRFFGWMEDLKMIRAEQDPYRKMSMLSQYQAKYGSTHPIDSKTMIWLGIPGY